MSDFDITRPLPEGITLVEASAGTGKTHNITGLVVRLVVEHGLRIDQILVVTFTRAATAELRGRVRARLRQTLETYDRALADPGYHPDEDDELLVYLLQRSREGGSLQADRNRARGAVDEFDQAAISTIHGFCQRMLHHNAFESGVEFGAELMEDVQPLVEEVVQDYWTRRIHDVSTPVLAHLAERKIGLDDLLDLSRKALATPDLTLIPDPPEVDTGRLEEQIRRWPEAANALARQWTDDRAMAVGQIRNALKKRALDGRVIRRDWFDPALKAMDQWLSTCPNPARPAPAGLRYFTRGLLEEAWARARRRRTRPRGYRLVPRPAHPVFDLAQELLDRQNVLAVELDAFALSLKYGLARTVRAQLTTRKRAGNALSFDDLLVDLRDGLHDPERGEHLRRAIRQQYHAALIDEFQDTDPVQWEIFREVFGGGRRLLLIGDPKQAIYAFRGADIFTYQSARESANEEHGLPENWRSDKPYVDAVNHLFDEKRVRRPFLFDWIGYHQVSAHHVESRMSVPDGEGGHSPVPPLRLRMVGREGADLAQNGWGITKAWANDNIPPLVAADVSELLAGGVRIQREGGVDADLRPRDVAVLVRTHQQGRRMQGVLRKLGINSAIHGADSVLHSVECVELERVLAAVTEPSRTSLVRAALATDLLGVSAADLAVMDTDQDRWEAWVERLRGWREVWNERGLFPMLRSMLTDQRIPERLLGWTDGERRMTNLLHLAELLQAAASGQRLNPVGLLAWLHEERQAEETASEARQIRLESDEDAVEIVTMHGCKGLQYPVVFCPYLWDGKLLWQGEDRNLRLHHESSGPVLDITLDRDCPPKQDNLEPAKLQRQAELLRLAYVALTRARHHCCVYWGWFSGSGSSPLAWLLHQPAGGGDVDPDEVAEALQELTDQQLLAALQELASSSGGAISVSMVEKGEAPTFSSGDRVGGELEALEYERPRFDTWWRRASYTQMTRASRDASHHGADAAAQTGDEVGTEAEGRDMDEHEDVALPTPEDVSSPTAPPSAGPAAPQPPDSDREVVLHDFPAGRSVGLALHKILELHDFARGPDELLALVGQQLLRHGLDAGKWQDRLTEALQGALYAPLGDAVDDLALSGIPLDRRLNELDFDIPLVGGLRPGSGAARVTRKDLWQVLEAHAGPAPDSPGSRGLPPGYAGHVEELRFNPLRGFLTGSIDLVFRWRRAWYIADYKSNRLGHLAGAYADAGLEQAMVHGHYVLQYLIYTVALNRYLKLRIPGYAYDPGQDNGAYFGGVYYLFLRGMAADNPPGVGVYHDRPSRKLVEALDALFQGGAP